MAREIRRSVCTCGETLWDKHTPGEIEIDAFCVCVYCAQLLRLNEELRLVPVTIKDVPWSQRVEIMVAIKVAKRGCEHELEQLRLQRSKGN